ncbi:MAG: DUF2089 domain-containing protein [Candidatus Latescibacteria bacterium]|jgi:hypothetical protein|nr:DUF2089 domain-containing protein [Candidatus Latescibacterota bacterium]
MRKIIEKCPACQNEVIVTRISCTRCECEVTGQFQPTIFNRLTPESLAFVETFVRLRGNIKEMERELSVPYSTIRNRLDEVILELGFVPGAHIPPPEPPAMPGVSQQEILKRLESGEITPEEATEELGKVK